MRFFKDTQILTLKTIFVAGLLFASTAHAGALFDELPRCDAPMTVYHVREGLHAVGPVPIIDIISATQVGGQSAAHRECRGTAITEDGNRPVTYEIGWHDPVNGIPYFRGTLGE